MKFIFSLNILPPVLTEFSMLFSWNNSNIVLPHGWIYHRKSLTFLAIRKIHKILYHDNENSSIKLDDIFLQRFGRCRYLFLPIVETKKCQGNFWSNFHGTNFSIMLMSKNFQASWLSSIAIIPFRLVDEYLKQ